jgi:hypothetical protein
VKRVAGDGSSLVQNLTILLENVKNLNGFVYECYFLTSD